MTTTPSPIIELQDEVLDFLLRYRAEKEPGLRFLLRKFNTNGMLEKGHWFPSSDEATESYFMIQFWGISSPFHLRVLKSGWIGLFYEVQTMSILPELQSESVKGLFDGFKDFEEFSLFEEGYATRYLVRWYSQKGKDLAKHIKAFLKGNDRKEIEAVIQKGEAWVHLGEKKEFGRIDEGEFNQSLQTVLEFREKRQNATLFPPLKPAKPKPGQAPIALESIVVRNFQGIEKTELFGLPRAPWIFLTGNNGYGKTSVLRAVFIGLYGSTDQSTSLAGQEADIRLRYWDGEQPCTNQLPHPDSPLKKIAAYGASRLSIASDASRNEIAQKNTASYSLFNTDGVLFSIENELRQWHYRDKERFAAVADCLTRLMPGIQRIVYDEASNQILYTETASDEQQGFEPLGFDKLASGFKSIIAIVGDLIIRFFQNNPSLKKPEDIEGIVIIDELELHLHPIWQRQLPALLSQAFPKVQFMASTHSPIPILGAPAGSLLLTVDRSKQEGITLKRLHTDIANLTPNLLFSSELFGMHDITAQSNTDRRTVRTETTPQEKDFHDELRNRLLKHAEGQGAYPENLFAKKTAA